MAAANWAGQQLPNQGRVLTDRSTGMLMSAYGRQDLDSGLANGYPVSQVFFSPVLGEAELQAISYDKVEYLVVDKRLASGLPANGAYFEPKEPEAYPKVSQSHARHLRNSPRAALSAWSSTTAPSTSTESTLSLRGRRSFPGSHRPIRRRALEVLQ